MTPLLNRITAMLSPLSDFYSDAGTQTPEIEAIDGAAMPQPYRKLLVHDDDMTPTLEAYTGKPIHLKLLQIRKAGDALYRQVVLVTNGTEEPIEFGAIRINLGCFDPEPRRLIEESYRPLGRILADYKIDHTSRPNGFFQIASDPVTASAFELREPRILYGRHNVLRDDEQRVLAEVVEILPPLTPDIEDETR